jgi:hypothetical protein
MLTLQITEKFGIRKDKNNSPVRSQYPTRSCSYRSPPPRPGNSKTHRSRASMIHKTRKPADNHNRRAFWFEKVWGWLRCVLLRRNAPYATHCEIHPTKRSRHQTDLFIHVLVGRHRRRRNSVEIAEDPILENRIKNHRERRDKQENKVVIGRNP